SLAPRQGDRELPARLFPRSQRLEARRLRWPGTEQGHIPGAGVAIPAAVQCPAWGCQPGIAHGWFTALALRVRATTRARSLLPAHQGPMLGDITNKKLIVLKGFLFLVAGVLASVLLIVEHPSLEVVLLLAIAVWSFARFYYFAFYVIEHYVDP